MTSAERDPSTLVPRTRIWVKSADGLVRLELCDQLNDEVIAWAQFRPRTARELAIRILREAQAVEDTETPTEPA